MMAINETLGLGNSEAANTAEAGRHGGWLATAISAVALCFSCISFYMSALQSPELEVFVPPTIHYGRDGVGDTELFAIPVTITNNGARTGAVLSMELEVQNLKTGTSKRYYSAFLGEHPREPAGPNRQFAPLSIPGRTVFSETVRFYPVGEALPKLVDAQGEYAFRLQLNTATPLEPSVIDRLQGRTQPGPLAFQVTLPWMSEQHLNFRRGTITMHAKDWKPLASAAR